MPAKFHEIPSMGLQDIKETKRYGRTDGCTDGRTDGQRENSIPPLKLRFGGGYNKVEPHWNNRLKVIGGLKLFFQDLNPQH